MTHFTFVLNGTFSFKSLGFAIFPKARARQNTNKHEMSRLQITVFLLVLAPFALESATDCSKLRAGQFLCPDPDSSYKFIDEKTQSVAGCTSERKAIGKYFEWFKSFKLILVLLVRCLASEGIICSDSGNNTFHASIPCEYT